MEVFTEVKKFYQTVNLMADDGFEILEPNIVFLTSYLTPSLKQHL
jgi:hypothetical protein